MDMSSSLSGSIHRDQAQIVSATLEQLISGEGNPGGCVVRREPSFDPTRLDTLPVGAYISSIDISTVVRVGA